MNTDLLPVGIYARQSIDKKDSISIETQIDFCKRKFDPDTVFEVFVDKGFSGKNTQRPGFIRMMKYAQEGRLRAICVYRLDRISRSLIDFLQMTSFFDQNKVGFSSATEPIETSTPYGKAIMSVLMVIAELERKNIQIRVKDNYEARGKKGYFLGGPRPYGFVRESVIAPDGYKTSRYVPHADEMPVVLFMYKKYAAGACLSEIAGDLNGRGLQTTRGSVWTSAKVSFLLTNPIYVKANADIYRYYLEKGVEIASRAEDFTGERSCFIFGRKKAGKQHESQAKAGILSLALHEGIIEPDIWLSVQDRLRTNPCFGNNGQSKISWLSGIIKCGYCGYALTATRSADRKKTKQYFTFLCNGRSQAKICTQSTKSKRVQDIEEIAVHMIFERVCEIENTCFSDPIPESCIRKTNELKVMLLVVEDEIRQMLAFIAKGGTAFSKIVERRAEELAKEQEELRHQLERTMALVRGQSHEDVKEDIVNWSQNSFEEKKLIAQSLISRITVTNDEVRINWKV